MRPEYWAVLTALFWGVGSFFEKKGVKLGGLSPVMGATIRTVTSMVLFTAISFPFWGQFARAARERPASIAMIAVGGGVGAGLLGLLCFYKGFATGELSKVMAIAFCLTPVIGALLGMSFLGDRATAMKIAGIALAVTGTALVTLG